MTKQNKKYQHHRPLNHSPKLEIPPYNYTLGEFERKILNGERPQNTPENIYLYAKGLGTRHFEAMNVIHVLRYAFEHVTSSRAEEIRRAFEQDREYLAI